jgi:galactokinase
MFQIFIIKRNLIIVINRRDNINGELLKQINFKKFEPIFKQLYNTEKEKLEKQYDRYKSLEEKFNSVFNQSPDHFFSVPGRVEIGGNHTDHNHGRVLAASINLDSIAAVSKIDSNKIIVYSNGYGNPFEVKLNDLKPKKSEDGNTNAIIRGIVARFSELGYKIGGFNAYITSDISIGLGLSSSASIEVLISTILNYLYNSGNISAKEIALIGQYSENNYFGKPCGLMDQLTCAVGGIITIDFKDPQNAIVKKVNFNFTEQNYRLLIIDTGGSHTDLTNEYATITDEMKAVASALGKTVCREIKKDELLKNIKLIRQKKLSDRAILRAIHFLYENDRVLDQVQALENGDFDLFLRLVMDSGNSSFKWLQNTCSMQDLSYQGINIALALTEKYIEDIGTGACRIHGGGFAGTILAFLPVNYIKSYIELLEGVFGKGTVRDLNIRSMGSIYLNHHINQ